MVNRENIILRTSILLFNVFFATISFIPVYMFSIPAFLCKKFYTTQTCVQLPSFLAQSNIPRQSHSVIPLNIPFRFRFSGRQSTGCFTFPFCATAAGCNYFFCFIYSNGGLKVGVDDTGYSIGMAWAVEGCWMFKRWYGNKVGTAEVGLDFAFVCQWCVYHHFVYKSWSNLS